MFKSHGLQINRKKLKDYETKDLTYKDQARRIICNKLGFEPPIELSVLGELCVRSSLKRYDKGEFDKKSLDEKINFHTNVINSVLLEHAKAGSC